MDWFDKWDIGKITAAQGAELNRLKFMQVSTAAPSDVLFEIKLPFLTRQAFKDGDMEEFFRGRAVVEEVRS